MKKPLIKIVKKARRKRSAKQLQPVIEPESSPWSQAVRAWVTEFRKNGDHSSVPSFNQVFSKQPLS